MSVIFASGSKKHPSTRQIQKLLDENGHLLNTILDYQNTGRPVKTLKYLQVLQRNLMFLSQLAENSEDSSEVLLAYENSTTTRSNIIIQPSQDHTDSQQTQNSTGSKHDVSWPTKAIHTYNATMHSQDSIVTTQYGPEPVDTKPTTMNNVVEQESSVVNIDESVSSVQQQPAYTLSLPNTSANSNTAAAPTSSETSTQVLYQTNGLPCFYSPVATIGQNVFTVQSGFVNQQSIIPVTYVLDNSIQIEMHNQTQTQVERSE